VPVRRALEGGPGKAPKVKLMGTHEATLEIVPLDLLKKYAIDLS
jgi:uncharacterized protein (DUF2237 family)